MYVYLKGVIDVENHFHNCVRESEKAILVQCQQKESRRIMHEETELNNVVNNRIQRFYLQWVRYK